MVIKLAEECHRCGSVVDLRLQADRTLCQSCEWELDGLCPECGDEPYTDLSIWCHPCGKRIAGEEYADWLHSSGEI